MATVKIYDNDIIKIGGNTTDKDGYLTKFTEIDATKNQPAFEKNAEDNSYEEQLYGGSNKPACEQTGGADNEMDMPVYTRTSTTVGSKQNRELKLATPTPTQPDPCMVPHRRPLAINPRGGGFATSNSPILSNNVNRPSKEPIKAINVSDVIKKQKGGYKRVPQLSNRLKVYQTEISEKPFTPPVIIGGANKKIKKMRGGNSIMTFNIDSIADLYEQCDVSIYLIQSKYNHRYNNKFMEQRLNKYHFALLLMLSYRLPTYDSLIIDFARSLHVKNIKDQHWIEIRNHNGVIAEYSYPFDTLYNIQKTLNTLEKNAYTDSSLSTYVINDITSNIDLYDNNSGILNKVFRGLHTYEKILNDNKIFSEFDKNIERLSILQINLLEELNKFQLFIAGIFDEKQINEIYKSLEMLSRPSYNEVIHAVLRKINKFTFFKLF